MDSPGVDAIVLPGNEFLLGNVFDKFDEDGNIKDQRTVDFLGTVLTRFVQFTNLVTKIDHPEKTVEFPKEDLTASGVIDTTIEGVDKESDTGVEDAAEKVKAARGNDYVLLDRGVLTVNQIDWFLKSMPMELTFADNNNQFLYYNRTKPKEEMLAGRQPGQSGSSLYSVHPSKALKNVEKVIQTLRYGQMDVVRVPISAHGPEKYVVHNYQAIKDDEGNYRGINEYILDFKPIVEFYLEKTGQKLVSAKGQADATAGASESSTDATAGASESSTDATAGASDASTDATAGASEN